jgi:alpha-galactosidase
MTGETIMEALSYGITLYDDRLERTIGPRRVVFTLPAFPLTTGPCQRWRLARTDQKPWKEGMEVSALYRDEIGGAEMALTLRVNAGSPFIRLRYALEGDARFAGTDGEQPIFYGKLQSVFASVTEIQLSQFDRILHSFVPSVECYRQEAFEGQSFIGPILITEGTDGCTLAAYEHGAQAPDHFLTFRAAGDELCLYSNKGNYVNGQSVGDYRAPWLQIGLADNLESMCRAYRHFMLRDVADNTESRKPYIFYNTWHHQEGRKYFDGSPVLTDMREEFILKDIDIARQMGVEVYVIDTGWYQKTGDWQVNQAAFPHDMQAVRERLSQYGMKLGLWFNPIVAARTSSMYLAHPEYVMKWQGKENFWG